LSRFQTLYTEITFDGGFLLIIVLHGPEGTDFQTLFTTDAELFFDENQALFIP
jgi:hypothetical protein